jgi:molybdate transport system substrate-binding protein
VARIALANPEAVPAGVHARRALTRAGLWEQAQSKVVSGDDVRHALRFVTSGAADAGVVYATDVVGRDVVRVVLTLPVDAEDPIRYVLATIERGGATPAAATVEQALSSPQGLAHFRALGFDILPPDADAP